MDLSAELFGQRFNNALTTPFDGLSTWMMYLSFAATAEALMASNTAAMVGLRVVFIILYFFTCVFDLIAEFNSV